MNNTIHYHQSHPFLRAAAVVVVVVVVEAEMISIGTSSLVSMNV